MQDEIIEALKSFFTYIWGDTSPDGKIKFVYLPVEKDGQFTPYMYEWPRQANGIIRHVLKWSAQGCNVFYSPALFKVGNPKKENVHGAWVLWVDFDGNAPDWDTEPFPEVPRPTLRIQSSIPGHEHDYWKLSEYVADPSIIEERNRSLAYLMHADTSGWDADQILRPPYTTNQKRQAPVTILELAR